MWDWLISGENKDRKTSKGNMSAHEVDEISLVLSELLEAGHKLSELLHRKTI